MISHKPFQSKTLAPKPGSTSSSTKASTMPSSGSRLAKPITPSSGMKTTTSSINKPMGTGLAGKKMASGPPEEEKKEALRPQYGKPSAKLANIKTSDPFAPKANKKDNSFAYVYNAGGIPCRIDHGSVNHRLKWDSNVDLQSIGFDPLLITCFEGLLETTHPYSFIAKQAIKELMESPGAGDKVIAVLPRLVGPLRNALSSTTPAVFEGGLSILKILSDVMGDALNEHLNFLIGSLVKRMNDRKYKETILEILHQIEENGGPSVGKIIKAKIPTYTNLV